MINPKTFIIDEFTKRINTTDFNINLLFQFLLLFTFLTVFFIFYISKVSTNAFNSELSKLTREIIENNIIDLKEDPIFLQINKMLPLKKLHNLLNTKQDPAVANKNDGLINTIITFNLLTWLLFIVIILILKYQCKTEFNLSEILLESTVTFIFVGMFEYYFFTRIASTYIPVVPSFISKQFLNSLKGQF